MAKKTRMGVYVRTASDQGFDYTLVSCRRGMLGGIYFLEDDDFHFRYSIQRPDGWWYSKTFERELEAIKYMVQNSFLMNWHYDELYIRMGDYTNCESGAITWRDNIESINLAA